MKPMHLAAAGAALAVGAVLLLMLGSDGARPRARAREVPPRLGPPAPYDPAASEAKAGFRYYVQLVVQWPDGRPVPGAELELGGQRRRRTSADAGGQARLDDLPPGAYNLLARSGSNVGALDFVLRRSMDLGVIRLTAALTLRGHVYDVRKQPVAGARVEAMLKVHDAPAGWAGFAYRLARPDAVAGRTSSQADGSYLLLLPGKGTYGLRASAQGFAVETISSRPFGNDGKQVGGIDFYLMAGMPLRGLVIDEQSRPVASARVVAATFPGRMQDTIPKAETLSTATGEFALSVPAGNSIYLSVRAPGYADYVEQRLQLTGRAITVIMKRGMALRLRTVEKQSGRPAAGVQVRVIHGGTIATGETNADGELVLDRLPPAERIHRGAALLFLSGGGYVPQRISLRGKQVTGGVLELGDLPVETGGTVRGRVRDKLTQEPIAGAEVWPLGRASLQLMLLTQPKTHTDREGRYELEGVALTTAAIAAVHEGYLSEMDQADLFQQMRPGARSLFSDGSTEAEVDLELVPAEAIRGVVLAPDGSPVAGARVEQLLRMGGGLARILGGGESSVSTDTRGRFRLTGLRRGQPVRLLARHSDYGTSDPLTVQAGRGESVTLHLAAPLALTGTVVDETGAPIAGVRVSVVAGTKDGRPAPGNQGPTRPASSDGAGRYLIRNAPWGEVVVTFDHRDYAVTARRAVAAAGAQEHDLGKTVLSRGPGIEGVVVDQEGRPLPDVVLNASYAGRPARNSGQRAGRRWANATTDEQGRFFFFGLSEGEYRLVLTGSRFSGDRPVVRTGTRDVRILAEAASELTGRIMASGSPVEGAWVQARLGGIGGLRAGNMFSSARSGPDGSFTLNRLPPSSTFTIAVTHGSYRKSTLQGVTAKQSGLVIELDPGIRIGGTVVEPDGAPVPLASLRVWVNGVGAKWGRADESGRFEFGGLRPGKLEIEMLSSPEGHIKTGRIAVEAGERAVRLVANPGETIAGKLRVESRERGSRGYRIQAISAEGRVAATAWASPGRWTFVVRGLERGRYTLRVSRFGSTLDPVKELEGISTGATGIEIPVD